jgi:hypothetical protein
MRALLIDPEKQTIEEIDMAGREDIARLVGFDTIESDAIGSEGDRLFFDEECFLRQSKGRFQIDTVIPVAGRGVIVGTAGADDELSDAVTAIEDLRGRIKFQ